MYKTESDLSLRKSMQTYTRTQIKHRLLETSPWHLTKLHIKQRQTQNEYTEIKNYMHEWPLSYRVSRHDAFRNAIAK